MPPKTENEAYDAQLVATPERLELRSAPRGGPRPLYVDFVGGPLGYMRRVKRFGLLFQAVGFRRGRPTVLDATAGLGADAFRLAYHGCRVMAVERSPIPFALLSDGLARALRVPKIHDHLGDRLQLIHADSRDVLRRLLNRRGSPADATPCGAAGIGTTTCGSDSAKGEAWPREVPDVVYLDPMFPVRKKSALVKVEMRILRQLVGDDPDAGELFELARAVARQRVVVKRHRTAEPLSPAPTHCFCDKTTRYDIYVRAAPVESP